MGETTYQYLAGFCVNIISISFGAFAGWPSASLLELQSESSPPLASGPVSNEEAGWICSSITIGGLLGAIVFTWCADKLGQKRCLLLSAIPAMIGWLIVPFATSVTHLYVSRLLGGFAGGGSFSVIPIYVAELAEDRVRGTLGTLMVFLCNLGTLCAFILGNFYSYTTVAWILFPITVAFVFLFSFMPDTPSHLMAEGKTKEAEKSLRYFRNVRDAYTELPEHVKHELERLNSNEFELCDGPKEPAAKLTYKDFTNSAARKGLILGIGMMALLQFSGCFAMLNYTASIFQQSGSKFSPKISAIIVGAIQLFGSNMPTLLIERAGRKILLVVSAIGVGIGQIVLGSYVHLTQLGYDTKAFSWVPIASFSFIIFIACCGVLSIPYVVLPEIFAPKIRDMSVMLCMLSMWIFGFIVLKFFPVMSAIFGMHGMCFAFASCCFVGATFLIIFLPETKGKSIETILALL